MLFDESSAANQRFGEEQEQERNNSHRDQFRLLEMTFRNDRRVIHRLGNARRLNCITNLIVQGWAG